MSKDQALGIAMFVICTVTAILYAVTLLFPSWLGVIGLKLIDIEVRFWAVAAPVLIAFVALMVIGAWMGWTMATTPPPKPVEEITGEVEERGEGRGEK